MPGAKMTGPLLGTNQCCSSGTNDTSGEGFVLINNPKEMEDKIARV
jgi:hypothetical protein